MAGSPFDYSISIGISDNTSEITKYDNPTLSLDETHYQGKKIGEIWGYVTAVSYTHLLRRRILVASYVKTSGKP